LILYVNGGSHCVGHGINNSPGMTYYDKTYSDIYSAPIPSSLRYSYGAILAEKMSANLVCQGQTGSSWNRVVRKTKQFVYQTIGKKFVLLGVPTIEREEWFYKGTYYQINDLPENNYPEELLTKYQDWLKDLNNDCFWTRKSLEIYQSAIDLHKWLLENNVPHFFFNFKQSLSRIELDVSDIFDFGPYYLEPCNDNLTYYNWCRSQKFNNDEWGHFNSDAHCAWAEFLYPYIKNASYDFIRKR